MDEHDDWQRVTITVDWVAGLIAERAGREPAVLVWPAILLGLGAGLVATMIMAGATGEASTTALALLLTLLGAGALATVAGRVMRGGRGGAMTADVDVLAPWLRRIQVLLAAVLVAVVGLVVYGASTGSVLLVVRNVAEFARVGCLVLSISWLLMDDDVGLPDWLEARQPVRESAR